MSNIVPNHIFIDDQPSITKRNLLLHNKPNSSLVGIGQGTPIIPRDGSGTDKEEQDYPLIGLGRGTRDQNSKGSWMTPPGDNEESVLKKLKSWPYLAYKYWMIINIVWTSLTLLASFIDMLEADHEISMIKQYNQGYRSITPWVVMFCFDVVFILLRILHLRFTWKAFQATRRQDSEEMAVVVKIMKIYIGISVIVEYLYMLYMTSAVFGSGYGFLSVKLAVKCTFFYLFSLYGALKIKKIL